MDAFKIIRVLGSGATGEALHVVERATNAEYVIKRISMEGRSAQEKVRAAREATILAQCNHPNIVRFHSSFFHNDDFCIVQEKCVCSLDDVIQRCQAVPEERRGFPQSLLIEWMTELLAALCYLQQQGIVHRDIKASNVFVTQKNHLKIGDFDVAHVGGGGGGAGGMSAGDSLGVVGTPHYLPPEMCDGATTASHKGDVWSLGVLFYEMCMLCYPFDGGNILAVVLEITTKETPALPPHFDARFNKIVRWMLKKEPSMRPTAKDVLDKYVFLPPSHPSHPQHDPDAGRAIQERHGPKLVIDAGGAATTAAAAASLGDAKSRKGGNKAAAAATASSGLPQQDEKRPPAAIALDDEDEMGDGGHSNGPNIPEAILADVRSPVDAATAAPPAAPGKSDATGSSAKSSFASGDTITSPLAVLISSTDSSKQQGAKSDSGSTGSSSGSIAQQVRRMLEERRGTLTEAELDDISVVVSEYRSRLKK